MKVSTPLHRALLHALLLTPLMLASACSTSRLSAKEVDATIATTLPQTELSPVDFAYHDLIKAGLSPEFSKQLETQFLREKKKFETRDKIVQLNVLGFLTPGDYSKHYSEAAVKKIRAFIQHYGKSLARAEKELQVPKEVIASLLWVETKHGKFTGQFPLPVVYYSLLQAKHPEIAKQTLLELNTRKPASNSAASKLSMNELQQKVIQRLVKKSDWAMEQLKVIEKLSLKQKRILSIHSSFAGAFGCSQFIPSSYEQFAVSATQKQANLFDMKDCIMSVANFLHQKGWKSDTQSQSDALFEYNRIRDYGDVILKLSQAAAK